MAAFTFIKLLPACSPALSTATLDCTVIHVGSPTRFWYIATRRSGDYKIDITSIHPTRMCCRVYIFRSCTRVWGDKKHDNFRQEYAAYGCASDNINKCTRSFDNCFKNQWSICLQLCYCTFPGRNCETCNQLEPTAAAEKGSTGTSTHDQRLENDYAVSCAIAHLHGA